MADRDKKRYYWLKLEKGFFKRHDIRIVESMPNGKDYIIFYLKLLCESTSHEGCLRFSEAIPYNEQMLSTITNTNVDVVRSACKIFTELGMMQLLDDGTIYMTEVQNMIGSETGQTIRKRIAKQNSVGKSLVKNTLEKELEKEIEIDKDIDIISKPKKSTRFVKPTVEEIRAYCLERKNGIVPEKFFDYYEARGWKLSRDTMKDWKATVRTWERNNNKQTQANQDLPTWYQDTSTKPVDSNTLEQALEIQRKMKGQS